jgi:L-ornithine N5-oxygenase
MYSETATKISLCSNSRANGKYLVQVDTGTGKSFKARSLCLAPGRSKHVPPLFVPLLGRDVLHFTDYTWRRDEWRRHPVTRPRSVAIVGSSQSAAEILLDMRAKLPEVALHSIFRNFSYVLKDTSPFTEDLVNPEFTDYFYKASAGSRLALGNQLLRSNYGSVDHDILRKLYFLLYENSINGDTSLVVHNNTLITDVEKEGEGFRLHLKDAHSGTVSALPVDAVILATGFKNSGRQHNEELVHPLLKDIEAFYRKNEDGTLYVTRDYQLAPLEHHAEAPPVFLNGLCESTHGLGDAGSFSLLSYRAHDIEQGLKRALGVATMSIGSPG